METEQQRRRAEELVYLDEYLNLINTLSTLAPKCSTREFDSLMKDLTLALHEKVAYILEISSQYRKELNFWERLKERRRLKSIAKELRAIEESDKRHAEEEKNKQSDGEQQHTEEAQQSNKATHFIASPDSQRESGLLETKESILQIEDKNANTDTEGDVLRF